MNDAHLGQETKKVSKNKSWCALDLWIKDDFSNENRQTGYVLYIYIWDEILPSYMGNIS